MPRAPSPFHLFFNLLITKSDLVGLTEEQAFTNYNIFGGIPRYVYQAPEQADATKQELLVKIRQLDMRALTEVLNDLEIVQDYHGKLSHMILQYEVNANTFKSNGIRFASDYVVEEVHKQKLETHLSEIGRALNDLTGPLAGQLFEKYATSCLTQGGRFRTYSLGLFNYTLAKRHDIKEQAWQNLLEQLGEPNKLMRLY